MYTIDKEQIAGLYDSSLKLLKQLIAIPSFSREESATAAAITSYLGARGIQTNRLINNVWAVNKYYNASKPTILLNSHHDTVKPNKDYTNNPFVPAEEDGKLYGLGSNDAGGCLVALAAAFLHFYDQPELGFNLLFAATAEEEISGVNGIERLLPEIGPIDFAIVGEPTLMNMAVAEKGLMVIDCLATGRSGHAAREEGENAIYKALHDIEWFRSFRFPKESALLGPVKMNVTIMQAGTQHNVVPDICNFVVDIRINDCYTHEEILNIIREHVTCDVNARSMRLRSTSINSDHPIVAEGTALGFTPFGSATLSDKALMPFPALKIGPGDSARSHTADEFIYLEEIQNGIEGYVQLLNAVL